MDKVPVFYATTEGHTRTIARAIASTLREQGFDSEALDLASQVDSPDWRHITSAVVGASIHVGRHQKACERFVEREAKQLSARPSAFFSVSLSAASRSPEKVEAVRAIAAKFLQQAGWSPRRLACIAGKLAYTKYGFFTRLLMRRIAKLEGQPTDTSHDYEYTDWSAVREFALGVAADIRDAGRPIESGAVGPMVHALPPADYSAPRGNFPTPAGLPH